MCIHENQIQDHDSHYDVCSNTTSFNFHCRSSHTIKMFECDKVTWTETVCTSLKFPKKWMVFFNYTTEVYFHFLSCERP